MFPNEITVNAMLPENAMRFEGCDSKAAIPKVAISKVAIPKVAISNF